MLFNFTNHLLKISSIPYHVELVKPLKTISSSDYLKCSKFTEIVDVICRSTEITNNSLTPEIKLRLITCNSSLWTNDCEKPKDEDPFWGFYWPGGQALSRYILDNARDFKNLEILDVGCGCGATAIAAAKSGARKVIANDIDSTACVATAINAEMNYVNLEVLPQSILGIKDIPWDYVVMGDMFYEEMQAFNTMNWLKQLCEQGKKVLIGDPRRLPLQKHQASKHFELLAEYKLPSHVINENPGFAFGYGINFDVKKRMFHSSSFLSCSSKSYRYYLSNSEFVDKIELIKKYTNISYNHITPEIGLRLITKGSEAWSWKQSEQKFVDPFWAFYWPGGQALTRYVLDNPKEFENETVLDVGCGSGATAIAAAYVRASEVVANDCSADSCVATALNTQFNGVNLEISQKNFIGERNIPWNCVLIGDMFYDNELSSMIFHWLADLHNQNKKIFIGDPGRFQTKTHKFQKKLKLLQTYSLKEDIIEYDKFPLANVLSFQ